MNGEIQELYDLKVKVERNVVQLEALLAEKDENLESVVIKLERSKKPLRLLNNGTRKLDHLILLVSHSVIIVVLVIKVSHLVQRLFLLNLVCLLILLMSHIISLL